MPVADWGAEPPLGIDAGYNWTFIAAWCNDDGTKIDPTGWTAQLQWDDNAAASISSAPQITVDNSYELDFGPDKGQGTLTVTVTVDGNYTSTLTFPRGLFRIALSGPAGADVLLVEVPVTINQNQTPS